MIKRLELQTTARIQLIDITAQVKGMLRNEQMPSGIVLVYVPHTTCGITINENADPSVKEDITTLLGKLVPADENYRHAEGNSDAHIKASLLGSSVTLILESGSLILGTWQGIYLAEFDGPRKRSVLIKIIPG
ncbi:MAG TPA: secondary thiamine-phosphate synthase enzyme YjbQ [Deltaproteobacteria bacterium]|nr:secondary thiamine-phosphate synthase enzyme YjbQ [Deltaproteobacteria bacterium]HPR53950.1 secondary thiamine-phosphate synthase enzyme YjbQ [Deltaproteobacteria bacterium]HXK46750.1 secondary thiamine-phosphate synthase enzyme YjbQ [Deltaproteobacteria bacterium]